MLIKVLIATFAWFEQRKKFELINFKQKKSDFIYATLSHVFGLSEKRKIKTNLKQKKKFKFQCKIKINVRNHCNISDIVFKMQNRVFLVKLIK